MTQHQDKKNTTNGALLCSLVRIACVVVVRVILVGVLGVMIVVLIGHDEVLVYVVIFVAIFVVIFCNWRCTLYIAYNSLLITNIKSSWIQKSVTSFPSFTNCGS